MMFRYLFLSVLLIFLANMIWAQTYEIDNYDGQTITTCTGTFSDSRYSGDYYNDENYTVTFCSGSTDFLKFIFNPGESDSQFDDGSFIIIAGDVLNVYDGTGTGGTLITSITNTNDPGDNHFILYSQSPCITFEWISNSSGDENGWRADIECVPSGCGTNPDASDNFADAPYICNLDGFCGTTSGNTEDNPGNMDGSGGNCPVLFGGTLENNSWIQFEASATSISLDVTVPVCYDGFSGATTNFTNNGIQMGILEYDGTNFTLVSNCAETDGNASGSTGQVTITSNSLVVGNTYYIMVDGYQGSRCDYYITTNAGVATLDAGPDVSACSGASTTLTATGPAGSTYSWTGSDGSGPTTGTSITVNPTTATTYTVTSTSGLCTSLTDDVNVSIMACASCSIDNLVAGVQTGCVTSNNTYTQEVIVTYSNPPSTGMLTVNGQNFAITTSPQTVVLTGLLSISNSVNVTASFTSDTGCTLTSNNLFTAPIPCQTCDASNGTWD